MICIKCGNKFVASRGSVICKDCKDAYIEKLGYLETTTSITKAAATELMEYHQKRADAVRMLLGGKTLKEVSDFLGTPRQAVAVWISRGTYVHREKKERKPKPIRYKPVYPENLYCEIFGTAEYDVPYGWENDIEYALGTITEREKNVLLYRFRDEITLGEVGENLGVTRERARQIEAKALKKLRTPARRKILEIGAEQFIKDNEAEEARKKIERQEIEAQLERRRQEFLNRPVDPNTPIREIPMSTRAFGCLKKLSVKRIGDISGITEFELCMTEGLGRKTESEIKAIMEHYLISFKPEEEEAHHA